jgi:very-short-patch-repair endonuclease
LDGAQHAEDLAMEYDRERADTLAQHGWTTLRFWNQDILNDIDNTCLHILRTIDKERP